MPAMTERKSPEHASGPDRATKRRGRAVAVGAAVEPLIEPLLRRRGFVQTRVARDWPAIVGAQLAAETMPVRLSFPRGERLDATLQIRVTGPLALELQHLAPAVIERINGYFGYRAVARISLIQAPRGHVPKPKPRRKVDLTPEEEDKVAAGVAGVADPGLRRSLGELGRAMLRARRSRPGGA
jgi:hypothetical protein